MCEVVELIRDRTDDQLPGRQPEWPLACSLLAENRDESLERTSDSTMENNWPLETKLQVMVTYSVLLLMRVCALLTQLIGISTLNRLLLYLEREHWYRLLGDFLLLPLVLDLFLVLGSAVLQVEPNW